MVKGMINFEISSLGIIGIMQLRITASLLTATIFVASPPFWITKSKKIAMAMLMLSLGLVPQTMHYLLQIYAKELGIDCLIFAKAYTCISRSLPTPGSRSRCPELTYPVVRSCGEDFVD